jgi:hypothetical protein
MSRVQWLAVLGLAGWLTMAPAAEAQVRPYIGYVYPAGGQRGTTFLIRLGGQGLDGANAAIVSGSGVRAKVVEYYRRLGPLEMSLLSEQLRELKKGMPAKAPGMDAMMDAPAGSMTSPGAGPGSLVAAVSENADPKLKLIGKIERRMAEHVATPASASISNLAFVEVTIAPDAVPGRRELRLATLRGVSNPLVFHVGQFPEICRKPMRSAMIQVLGKEELALRKRPDDEVEQRITAPCTVNGQIASGEVNRYRFEARKGQRLVLSTDARALIPYMADAVPGWFQPVLAVYDAQGKELAYNDDYRFKPDPTLVFEVPRDGEYLFTIADAIYRGREDFVYRVTIGEMPYVTSIFPLGGRAGKPVAIKMKGWNLEKAELAPPANDAAPGIHLLVASQDGQISNRVPFALGTLPEGFDKEPNDDRSSAQKVTLPLIVNGRVNRPDDWDVFQFTGRAGETVVVEVEARRLDSPLDSMIKITDPAGKLLAVNDDYEDWGAGANTHHADSYLLTRLPADGTYCVHLGDSARNGGGEYGYRLRISAPQPDFALRIVPSSIAFRSKTSASVAVQVLRKDGFAGPISLSLKDPPAGFTAAPSKVPAGQNAGRLAVKTDLLDTKEAVTLHVVGTAKIGDGEIVHEAVPAEDRMQAFLWRHMVPAQEFKALVFDPDYVPPPKRVSRVKLPTL